jgi:hypothetical protein
VSIWVLVRVRLFNVYAGGGGIKGVRVWLSNAYAGHKKKLCYVCVLYVSVYVSVYVCLSIYMQDLNVYVLYNVYAGPMSELTDKYMRVEDIHSHTCAAIHLKAEEEAEAKKAAEEAAAAKKKVSMCVSGCTCERAVDSSARYV